MAFFGVKIASARFSELSVQRSVCDSECPNLCILGKKRRKWPKKPVIFCRSVPPLPLPRSKRTQRAQQIQRW